MAFNYSPKVVTDGLILYVDAANRRSYSGTGTDWSDISRGNITGSLINGPAYNPSFGQGSISFDGTDDYADYGNLSNRLSTTTVTYNVWLRWGSSSVNKTILGNEPYNVQVGLGLRQRSDGKYWVSPASNQPAIIQYAPVIATSNWHMVSITKDVTTTTLYINGSSVATGTYTAIISSTASFNIGRITTPPPPSEYWSGSVGSFQLYTRALSSTEVLQNYNATRTRFGL